MNNQTIYIFDADGDLHCFSNKDAAIIFGAEYYLKNRAEYALNPVSELMEWIEDGEIDGSDYYLHICEFEG